MKKIISKGFTLIEIMVVLTIMTLLVGTTVATMSGYFEESRDGKRLTFIRNIQQITIAAKVTTQAIDFRLGETSVTDFLGTLNDEVTRQGYVLPGSERGINYYMFLGTSDISTTRADDFVVFTCRENELGNAGTQISDIAFTAGTTLNETAITLENTRLACASLPVEPTIETGWTCIDLSAQTECGA